MPANFIGKRRHHLFHPRQSALFTGEVVHNQHLTTRFAHPRHFGDHLFGVGHHRHQIHRHNRIEMIIRQFHRAGVHFVNTFDMGHAALDHLFAGLGQHMTRNINTRDLQMRFIML